MDAFVRAVRFRGDKGLRVRAKRKQATWHVTSAHSFNSALKEQAFTRAVNRLRDSRSIAQCTRCRCSLASIMRCHEFHGDDIGFERTERPSSSVDHTFSQPRFHTIVLLLILIEFTWELNEFVQIFKICKNNRQFLKFQIFFEHTVNAA